MRVAFRDIELDPERFELTRAGDPVRLEPQAFEVLAYLIAHRDRVVTRDELMEAIWGSVYVSDAALATRIKEARRALGDDGTTQWAIRTIHRRGYRFVVDPDEAAAVPGGAAPEPPEGAQETDGGHDAYVATPSDDGTLVPPQPSTTPGVAVAPAPMVAPIGREAEFERLVELHHATGDRGTQVVFITGEAGIGKSTLVGEFFRQVGRQDGVLCGRGQCIEGHGASEGYLPFVDAIGQLASGPQGSVAVQVLQQEAPTWLVHLPGLASESAPGRQALFTRERMLRELTGALDRIGKQHRVVISLEDLHWSDPSTLDALEMLCRRESEAQVLVVGTLRTGDPLSGSHPVHTLAAELTTRGYATTIQLGPLGEAAIQRLIKGRATEALDPGVAALVTERSGGNPLFAASLIEHWVHSDGPRVEPLTDDVPESLRQLVSRQLEHVTEDHRRVMEAAAVAGDTLTPSITAAISGLALDLVEEILDSCARKGQFLRRRGAFEWPNGDLEDEYQFIHSLFRETALSSLPLGRRARMHRAAGEALVERLGLEARHHIDEIANHFVHGGDADRAVPALISAARRARSRSAHREARELLERALSLITRVNNGEDQRQLEVEVQTLLGAVAIAVDGWAAPSILSAYERALDLVHDTDDESRIREILAGLATTHEFRGEYEEAQRIITEQISLIPPGTPAPAESHELLACSLFHQGQLHRSLEEAETGLQIALMQDSSTTRTAYGEHPATACRMWIAQSWWFLGDVQRALRETQETLDTAPDDTSRLQAHYHAGMVAQYSGDIRSTRHHARRMYALAQSLGFESHEVASGLLRAWAEAAAGYAEALPLLERAVDVYRASGMRMDLPWVLALFADALLAHDRVDEAGQMLDEAFQVRDPGRGYVFEPEMWRLRGRVDSLRGRREDAAEHYRRAVETARAQDARTPELRALTALLGTGVADDATVQRLRTLVAELDESGLPSDVEAAREVLSAQEPVAG